MSQPENASAARDTRPEGFKPDGTYEGTGWGIDHDRSHNLVRNPWPVKSAARICTCGLGASAPDSAHDPSCSYRLAAYAMRLTACKCGHSAVQHWDSYDFCTWTMAEPPECECEKFEAAGPEILVQVGQTNV